MRNMNKLGVVAIAMAGVLIVGCGKKSTRQQHRVVHTSASTVQINPDSMLSHMATARYLGVQPEVMAWENTIIQRYLAYRARQGITGETVLGIWAISRQYGMLPSQYISRTMQMNQQRTRLPSR